MGFAQCNGQRAASFEEVTPLLNMNSATLGQVLQQLKFLEKLEETSNMAQKQTAFSPRSLFVSSAQAGISVEYAQTQLSLPQASCTPASGTH